MLATLELLCKLRCFAALSMTLLRQPSRKLKKRLHIVEIRDQTNRSPHCAIYSSQPIFNIG